jgi:hypothetical protein
MQIIFVDGICGLVVRVSGRKPRGSRFGSRRYQIFCVGVVCNGAHSDLVRINEELLERKVATPV